MTAVACGVVGTGMRPLDDAGERPSMSADRGHTRLRDLPNCVRRKTPRGCTPTNASVKNMYLTTYVLLSMIIG